MTASLDIACREIDQLLAQCMVAWADAIDREAAGDYLVLVHTRYLETCTCLYDARAALEAAIGSVNTVADWRAPADRKPPGPPETRASAPVVINIGCCGTAGPQAPVQPAAAGSSSRPDRPSRSPAPLRGTIRDWNRDILARAQHDPAEPGCICGQPGSNDVGPAAAEPGGGGLSGSGAEGRSPKASRRQENGEDGWSAAAGAMAASGPVQHQPDRAGSKELADGKETKPTRSRRRG